MSVFAQTDKEERTCETITKKNAMDFKRTGDFIMILELFEEQGGLTQEWVERKKYCTYKAGTIMKALKAGEQPPRGNPFAPEEEKKEEAMPSNMEESKDPIPSNNNPPAYQPQANPPAPINIMGVE